MLMIMDEGTQGRSKRWHFAAWPPLAWLETAIKAAALVVGLVALRGALSSGEWQLPAGIRAVQFALLVLLSLGLVAAIFDRLDEREIVAMVFVLFNNLGHWGMTAALASQPGPGNLLVVFCLLMLVGDLVKLLFIRVHDFTVRGTSRAVLYGLTSAYVFGYAAILLLELLR
jgi:hypothetical protein